MAALGRPSMRGHKARCLVSSQQWHLPSRLFFVVRTENDAQIVSRSKLKVFGLEHFFESSTPYNFDFVAIHTFHHFSYPIRTSQGSCVLRISGIPCLFVGVTPRSRRCGHVQTPFTIELYTVYSWTFHLNTFFFAFWLIFPRWQTSSNVLSPWIVQFSNNFFSLRLLAQVCFFCMSDRHGTQICMNQLMTSSKCHHGNHGQLCRLLFDYSSSLFVHSSVVCLFNNELHAVSVTTWRFVIQNFLGIHDIKGLRPVRWHALQRAARRSPARISPRTDARWCKQKYRHFVLDDLLFFFDSPNEDAQSNLLHQPTQSSTHAAIQPFHVEVGLGGAWASTRGIVLCND